MDVIDWVEMRGKESALFGTIAIRTLAEKSVG